ncbi:MAG: hypothetical protein ACLR7U_03000 [Ruthenibacterium lactatiformans]
MMRITRVLCEKESADAIVTGESLAQVASQTLKAIACTDAAQSLPVARPCIGMDKTEITDIARKIDTYETSILPYEDSSHHLHAAPPENEAPSGWRSRPRRRACRGWLSWRHRAAAQD